MGHNDFSSISLLPMPQEKNFFDQISLYWQPPSFLESMRCQDPLLGHKYQVPEIQSSLQPSMQTSSHCPKTHPRKQLAARRSPLVFCQECQHQMAPKYHLFPCYKWFRPWLLLIPLKLGEDVSPLAKSTFMSASGTLTLFQGTRMEIFLLDGD